MARHAKSFLPRLTGYTAPLVIDFLQAVGPPIELLKLPQHLRGALMVSLVGELATALSQLIIAELSGDKSALMAAELESVYLSLDNGVYRKAHERVSLARSTAAKVMGELQGFTRFLVDRQLAFVDEKATSALNKKAGFEGHLCEVLEFCKGAASANLRQRYKVLFRRYQVAVSKISRAVKKEAAVRTRLQRSEEFEKINRDLLERLKSHADDNTQISFSRHDSIFSIGAAHYLRNTDSRWWTAFVSTMENRINDDLRLRPLRLAFRDPTVNLRLQELTHPSFNGEPGRENLRTATDKLLHAPSGSSGPFLWTKTRGVAGKSRSDEAGRGWRFKLREEDVTAQKWIRQHAGTRHPLDPYRTWLATRTNSSSQRESLLLRTQNGVERAMNELHRCLSRRDPANYPFIPFPGSLE